MRISNILFAATLAVAASMTPIAAQAADTTYTAQLSASQEVIGERSELRRRGRPELRRETRVVLRPD